MTSPENNNNDSSDLHRISPNLRHEMLQIEKQVVAEAQTKLKRVPEPTAASHWERLKTYGYEHRKGLGFGVGSIALMAVVAGVSWQTENSTQTHNRRAMTYAVHEVLTHPVDLLALGVCPDQLRYQADKLPGKQAQAYRQAASKEEALGVPCEGSAVASLTINLPNAEQTVVTPVDIVPAIF